MPSLIMALKDITELFQSTLSPKATTKRTKNRYFNIFIINNFLSFFFFLFFNEKILIRYLSDLQVRWTDLEGVSELAKVKTIPNRSQSKHGLVSNVWPKSSEKSEMIHHLAHHTYMQDWHNEIANPTYFVTCKLWRNIFKTSVQKCSATFLFFHTSTFDNVEDFLRGSDEFSVDWWFTTTVVAWSFLAFLSPSSLFAFMSSFSNVSHWVIASDLYLKRRRVELIHISTKCAQ